MRIRTDGKHSHRKSTIEEAAERYDCNKTRGLMLSVQMDRELRAVLQAALDHPDMTEDLAEAMDDASRRVSVSYEVDTELSGEWDPDADD